MLNEKIFYVTQENKDVIIRIAADCLRYSKIIDYTVEHIQQSIARFERERSKDAHDNLETRILLDIVKNNTEKIIIESMKPNLEPWENWTKYFSIENELHRKFKKGIITRQEMEDKAGKAQREIVPDLVRNAMKRNYGALRATPLCYWIYHVSGMMMGVPECEIVGIYEIPA